MSYLDQNSIWGTSNFPFPRAWVQHTRREADHSPPSQTEEKNEWNHISTHFHIGIQEESFCVGVYNKIWPIAL